MKIELNVYAENPSAVTVELLESIGIKAPGMKQYIPEDAPPGIVGWNVAFEYEGNAAYLAGMVYFLADQLGIACIPIYNVDKDSGVMIGPGRFLFGNFDPFEFVRADQASVIVKPKLKTGLELVQ